MPKQTKPSASPITNAWRTIIRTLGYDPKDPHLVGSPDRVGRFFEQWHQHGKVPPSLTTFPNQPPVDELVVTSGIVFYSVCAHHGVPFFGTAAVGYIPRDRVLGLSKFARVIDFHANRFQTQERLTHEIATSLDKALDPVGLGVVLHAEHLCMSMRGIRKPGHRTTTSHMTGALRNDAGARAEFMALVRA